MRILTAFAWACALALSAGSPAAAQTTEERLPLPGAADDTRGFPPPVDQIYGTPSYRTLFGPFGAVFDPPATRVPFGIIPSLTIAEEYNDNLFLDNSDRRSDFITVFTPGVTFAVQQPTYRLVAGANFAAEVYADHSELNNVGDRVNFFVDGLWDVTPRLTLTLTDLFIRSYSTPRVTEEPLATGRVQFWTNTFTPALAYRLTPRTRVRVLGSYAVRRIEDDVAGASDSDTYRAEGVLEHALRPRLTGTLGYQFAHFDFERAPAATTHTPRIGASYRVTPTLTVSASAGPSIQVRSGDTTVVPAATASLVQQLAFGWLTVNYNRSVGAPGTLAQTTENQTIGAALVVTTLRRGLTLALAPRYTTIEADTFDTDTFTLDLSASYQLTPWLSVFGSYALLRQRSEGLGVLGDIDQNRLFVGLQVRYPIDLR